VHDHLTSLERSIARRVTGGDVRGFMKVISAIEEEAHRATHAARARRETGRARGR